MAKSPPNEPLKPGFRLTRYVIQRKLSAGGFGVVYLALREDGQPVAIKEFLPSMMSCRPQLQKGWVEPKSPVDKRRFREGLETFFKEADTLSKIHDDRVIAVWDVFEAHGTAYFVMPVERGNTLQAAIRSSPMGLDYTSLRNIFIQAAHGVEVLHRHGLLHLDLKPSNLWLRPDQSVVVLDLGASRWTDEEGNANQLARTPGFAAPEQHGKVQVKDLTVRTDVYGLSATLYASLEGHPPPQASVRRPHDPPLAQQRLGQHPTGLLQLIDQGMHLNPQERFSSVQQWREALEKIPKAMPARKYTDPL